MAAGFSPALTIACPDRHARGMSWHSGAAIGWGYAQGHPWVVAATALLVAAFAVAFFVQRAASRRRGRR